MKSIINLSIRGNKYINGQLIYDNAFTPDECNKIINLPGEMKPSMIGGEGENKAYEPSLRNSSAKRIFFIPETQWLFNKLIYYLQEVNNNFFHFIIDSIKEVEVLKYDEGSFFNLHSDLGTDEISSTRKLSLVVMLSAKEDYDGGELEFVPPNNDKQQNIGSLFIFPSYIPHQVKPVTGGTRHTLVAWAHGPHFC
jgi:PKHD-type hydroxylase